MIYILTKQHVIIKTILTSNTFVMNNNSIKELTARKSNTLPGNLGGTAHREILKCVDMMVIFNAM